MRESVRPIVKLAVFGTYTILAIGIAELRGTLRKVTAQAKQRSSGPGIKAAGRAAGR